MNNGHLFLATSPRKLQKATSASNGKSLTSRATSSPSPPRQDLPGFVSLLLGRGSQKIRKSRVSSLRDSIPRPSIELNSRYHDFPIPSIIQHVRICLGEELRDLRREIGLMSTTQRDDDADYESDPEETKRSLVIRRRRAASDDEEDRAAGGGREKGEGGDNVKHTGVVQSDESDGAGAAAEYDDDEYYSEGDEGSGEVEVGYREEGVEVFDNTTVSDEVVCNERVVGEGGPEHVEESVRKEAGGMSAATDLAGEWGEDQGEEEEEENLEGKKENEPYAVPTAGAFYMHDDRFRDYVGGRNRRTFGGRKLWESKDNRKWGHDKYEEMTIQERRYDERRGRGNHRGRGRNRTVDRGYPRGYGEKSYDNNQPVVSTNTSNQNQVARSVRGRGPRKYEASFRKSSQTSSNQIKQSMKRAEESLQDNVGQSIVSSMNMDAGVAPARTQTFASSLNFASPPFYPSSSSSKDVSSGQRKDAQLGNASKINRPTVVDDNFTVPEPDALSRGKNIADSIGMEKLYVDDSFAATAVKPLSAMSAAPVNGSQSLQNQTRAQIQGRSAVFPVGSMSYQPISGRTSTAMRVNFGQKGAMSNRVHTTAQQPGQRPGSVQNSSPSKVSASVNSYEVVDTDSPTESNKLAGALVSKGISTVQGSGRGSVIYTEPPVVGAGGNTVGHGDKNFPSTPAFLPVMQFGGQHPGGLGLSAVGMAFPGYVAQPQLGMGSSEMTWLPVLTGAAGALGAAYCPPYITVDGSYHSPSGQMTSVSSSSKESHSNKPNNEWKPAQRPEVVNEDYVQRQNKPRRYSEMNFGQ